MKWYAFLMLLLASGSAIADDEPIPPSADKAEMMGRVEWVMMHGGRDVTARKSIEWGDVEKHENGNRSIRYKYRATIWDKDVVVANQIFTFDPNGKPVSTTNVDGFPKKEPPKKIDIATKNGMIELVEDFFRNNFRDITKRRAIEWGDVSKDEKGNSSIRYKYHATIWDKDEKVMNQVFTFDPSGKFVSVKDAPEKPRPQEH